MSKYFLCVGFTILLTLMSLLAIGTTAEDKKPVEKEIELVEANPAPGFVGGSRRITVGKIVSAKAFIQETMPPSLVVKAAGEVPNAGYKDPMLNRVVYVIAPTDGIQDYYFTAITPPDGTLQAQVITKLEASDTWKDYPKWVKGIRIHGTGVGVMTYKFK